MDSPADKSADLGAETISLTTSKSKYREIARALRDEISDGVWQPGGKLPGEQDLAKRFGVSYMTMRQAVNNLVTDELLVRIQGKGTFVVIRSEAAGKPATAEQLALLVPAELQRISPPYYLPEVLQGFQDYVESRSRQSVLHNYEVIDEPGALKPGSAIACLLINRSNVAVIEKLRDQGHRVLAINRYSGNRSIPSVRIDDAVGVEQGVGLLAALGHERIGFVLGPRDVIDAADRLRGFRNGIKRYGLREALEAGEGFSEAEGYAAALSMLVGPNPPTALMCASDLSAIGAVRAAKDCGLAVPQTLSVIGFGDFPMAHYLSPSLTTIKQSRIALGRNAAEALIMLSEGQETSGIVLSADLTVRESTAPRHA